MTFFGVICPMVAQQKLGRTASNGVSEGRPICRSLSWLGVVQVVLYLLLMEERYGVQMERGLLQYLSDRPPEVGS